MTSEERLYILPGTTNSKAVRALFFLAELAVTCLLARLWVPLGISFYAFIWLQYRLTYNSARAINAAAYVDWERRSQLAVSLKEDVRRLVLYRPDQAVLTGGLGLCSVRILAATRPWTNDEPIADATSTTTAV